MSAVTGSFRLPVAEITYSADAVGPLWTVGLSGARPSRVLGFAPDFLFDARGPRPRAGTYRFRHGCFPEDGEMAGSVHLWYYDRRPDSPFFCVADGRLLIHRIQGGAVVGCFGLTAAEQVHDARTDTSGDGPRRIRALGVFRARVVEP